MAIADSPVAIPVLLERLQRWSKLPAGLDATALGSAMNRLQDQYWATDKLGGPLRFENHYGTRRMMCFSERPETLSAMFADLVRRFPGRPAVTEQRTLSYAELDGIVARIASGLAKENIKAGDRVALLLGNCWEFLVVLLACARLGIIVVPMGTKQRRAELALLLDDCGARALIFEAEFAAAVPAMEELRQPRQCFVIHGETPDVQRFSELMSASEAAPIPRISEEDTAVILYTSGTTGRPKGARLTHLGIIHSALTFARCHGLTEDDRGLVAVPLSHVTGLVGVSLATMIVVAFVVIDAPRPFQELTRGVHSFGEGSPRS